jgi:predicted XRE-type DNA-binding protein
MDWIRLLSDLTASGLTQAEIASEVGVTQSSISDLKRGTTTRPNFELGNKLVQLHKRVMREVAAKAA